jgi:hypothetical protein
MLNTKEERDKLRLTHGHSTSASSFASSASFPPVATRLNPAYDVHDEDIYTVLSQKRVQEDVEGKWDDETVLVLRSFYEEPPQTRDHGEQEDGEGVTETRGILEQPGLPISPPLAAMHESAAYRLFVTDLVETEQRRPLRFRIAPQPEDSSSDSDESEDANEDAKGDIQGIESGEQTTVVTESEANTSTTAAVAPMAEMNVEDTNGGEREEQLTVAEERDGDAIETEAVGTKDDDAQQAVAAPISTSTVTNLMPEETVNELINHYLRIPGFYAVRLFPVASALFHAVDTR